MMIEVYKQKLGYYPQDNPKDVANPPLFHELTGTRIPDNYTNTFGVLDIANVNSDAGTNSVSQNFFPGLKNSQFQEIGTGTRADTGKTTRAARLIYAYGNVPWRYNVSSPTNNPGSFDLWVELDIGGKKHVVGNWKN
jgi:hypothetical protein